MSDWPYRYFSRAEMACKHTGRCEMDPGFMLMADGLREAFGKSMIVTSGYRDPSHPEEVRKREDRARRGLPPPLSTHSEGIAMDVAVRGADAVRLLELALSMGFRGIGVQQKGDTRFLHLDTRKEPAIWSY